METVAASDGLAMNLHRLMIGHEIDSRRKRFEVTNGKPADVEHNGCARLEPHADQVLDDFLLAVHSDRTSSSQLGQADAMPCAAEAQLDAVMHQAFLLQAFAHTCAGQQVNAALLQHAGTHSMLDMLAAARLEHD